MTECFIVACVRSTIHMYDALCYGALCADNLISLPRFPVPGEGMRVASDRLVPGGNALNEARCLTAWGNRVALMGDHLGDDPEGALLRETVDQSVGLDGSFLKSAPGSRTPLCRIMITPDGQRTVLAVRSNDHPSTAPSAELLEQCRVVSVTYFGAGVVAAAEAARRANKLLVIGDALLPGEPLASLADVIVGSADQVRLRLPGADLAEQMHRLHAIRSAAVIVTDGPRPARALVDGAWLSVQPPSITPRDTTGAGDCFRAGITHGLIHGWDWPRTLTWACAAASAWCMLSDNQPPSLAMGNGLLAMGYGV